MWSVSPRVSVVLLGLRSWFWVIGFGYTLLTHAPLPVVSSLSSPSHTVVWLAQKPLVSVGATTKPVWYSAESASVTVVDIPAEIKEPLESVVVVTEDALTSIVKRGENGGRTLHHDGVVRLLFRADVGAAHALAYRGPLNPAWRRDRLHLNALLQGKKSRQIWGAATVPLK